MYIPPTNVVIDAESLKPFEVSIVVPDEGLSIQDVNRHPELAGQRHPGRTKVESITIHARDEEAALDIVTRYTSIYDTSSGKRKIGDVGVKVVRADGKPGGDAVAIGNANELLIKIEAERQAELKRHATAIQAIEDRLQAASAELRAIKHGVQEHSRRPILESRRPGISEELRALRANLENVQWQLLIEQWDVTQGNKDKREAEARQAVAEAEQEIQEVGERLKNFETAYLRDRLIALRRSLPRLRRQLQSAVAVNAQRKPLSWHREREAAIVAEYNALVAKVLNGAPSQAATAVAEPEIA